MGRGTQDTSHEEPRREEKPAVMRDESMATAATKIQAGFRGYKVRKQMKLRRAEPPTSGRQDRSASLEERSATTIQAGIRGFLVRKKRQQEQQAATKIQAGFRGFKARRAAKSRTQPNK